LNEIKESAKVDVHKSTMSRYLKAIKVKRRKINFKPELTEKHKKERLNFAEKFISYDSEWRNVWFSDEKKFNLDGPDGYNYYWSLDGTSNNKIKFSKTRSPKGSVMIWGAINFSFKIDLVIMEGKFNSIKYCEMLGDNFICKAHNFQGNDFIFQQDNASIHTSKYSREVLEEENINTLDWPARSPDLNPIENVWGRLTQIIYKNSRSYKKREDLKNAINEAWEQLPQSYFQDLVGSMKKRLREVIKQDGDSIKY
jgi:transposase